MMSTFRLRPLCIAATALMAGLPFAQDLWAQTVPPPVIVPQVTPRLNDPGPQSGKNHLMDKLIHSTPRRCFVLETVASFWRSW